jgi:hypothetical protein
MPRTRCKIDAMSLDDARAKLLATNWYEAARKGKGIARWRWGVSVVQPALEAAFGELRADDLTGSS